MLDRDMRMFDMQIMASLQNGTAFFASTSLLAIGGALTLLRSPDDNSDGRRRPAVRRSSRAACGK